MSQGGQWVWEVMESYHCGQEADVAGEEHITKLQRTGNLEEEFYKELIKRHEEKKHVEDCRTAVERRATFLVKNTLEYYKEQGIRKKKLDKLYDKQNHVEDCRTAVERRATFPVKSSAPHTRTSSRPKGRPIKPAVLHHS